MSNQLPAILNVSTIPTIENMNIKTEVLDPITITASQAVFMLPKTGILDGGSMLQLGVTGLPTNFLPFNTGIHGAIRSCFLKCGGKVIASNDDYAYYTTMTRQFQTPEHRAYVDMVKTGAVGDRWAQTASGRIGFRDANSSTASNGTNTCPLFLRPTQSDGTTPLFSIPLSTLIPMMKSRQLPLMAIKEHIYLEVNFNSQTAAGSQGVVTCVSSGRGADASVAVSLVNVKFISDHLYYEQEKMSQLLDQSLSSQGLTILYEDLITTNAQVQGLTPASAVVTPQTFERDIAVAGKTVRNILIQEKNSNEIHPVFGQYLSRDLVAGGSYNFRINDQRVYDRDVSNPARKYNELAQVFGKPLMVPTQAYSYDVDSDKTDPSRRLVQTSMSIGVVEGYALPEATGATLTNDLRACSHYTGYDATTTGANVLGNGAKIGVKPINLVKTFNRTLDDPTPGVTPLGDNYSPVLGQIQPRELRIFCSVERIMVIRNGEITLTA